MIKIHKVMKDLEAGQILQ